MAIPDMASAMPESRNNRQAVVQQLGPVFAGRAAAHDEGDTFVSENYADLKRHRVLSAAVPRELGGSGMSHAEVCALLRDLAHSCGSTALALAMHQHLVCTTVWKFMHGQGGEPLLRKVAEQELVLVSTGAHDWLESNGTAVKVEGGYRVSGRKPFASGSPAGDMLLTSARYDDPADGAMVLHFAVPLAADGVTLLDDWRTLGMRGTGSQTVVLEQVFVPETSISVRRPRGVWHPSWSVVATVALPLIMSVYVGIAEAAAEAAQEQARKRADDGALPYLLGEMINVLTTARLALDGMIRLANDYDFEATVNNADAALIHKTICAKAVMQTAEKALEVVGGAGFFRGLGLERLLRDVHAAQFHPLPEKEQQRFTGRLALGLDAIEG